MELYDEISIMTYLDGRIVTERCGQRLHHESIDDALEWVKEVIQEPNLPQDK